jgi:hypothetical protein
LCTASEYLATSAEVTWWMSWGRWLHLNMVGTKHSCNSWLLRLCCYFGSHSHKLPNCSNSRVIIVRRGPDSQQNQQVHRTGRSAPVSTGGGGPRLCWLTLKSHEHRPQLVQIRMQHLIGEHLLYAC